MSDYKDLIALLRDKRERFIFQGDSPYAWMLSNTIESLQAENEQRRNQLHTCHPDCSKAGCVNGRLRRDIERLRKEKTAAEELGNSYLEEIDRLRGVVVTMINERDRMRSAAMFGLCVLEDARENLGSDVGGDDIQDWAIAHGLLTPVHVTEPCGEDCTCEEWDDFPQECLRYSGLTRWLINQRAQEKGNDSDQAFHNELRDIARETGTTEAVKFAEKLIAAGVKDVKRKRDE